MHPYHLDQYVEARNTQDTIFQYNIAARNNAVSSVLNIAKQLGAELVTANIHDIQQIETMVHSYTDKVVDDTRGFTLTNETFIDHEGNVIDLGSYPITLDIIFGKSVAKEVIKNLPKLDSETKTGIAAMIEVLWHDDLLNRNEQSQSHVNRLDSLLPTYEVRFGNEHSQMEKVLTETLGVSDFYHNAEV
jgi:hypothetical protein